MSCVGGSVEVEVGAVLFAPVGGGYFETIYVSF